MLFIFRVINVLINKFYGRGQNNIALMWTENVQNNKQSDSWFCTPIVVNGEQTDDRWN